tara:strand:+ start:610 stop:798 length:189 start_codon:yes stop_codon:yes gene_type:complete
MYSIGLVNLIIFNLLNGIKLIRSKKKIKIIHRMNPHKTDDMVIIIFEELIIFFIDKNLINNE